MWELDHKEGWVLKNWFFLTVVLEKTLESPLCCRRSNHWILKEISPEYSLEWLMLKLKLQYHSSKASILQRSAFFMAQLSHPYMTTGYWYFSFQRNWVCGHKCLDERTNQRPVLKGKLQKSTTGKWCAGQRGWGNWNNLTWPCLSFRATLANPSLGKSCSPECCGLCYRCSFRLLSLTANGTQLPPFWCIASARQDLPWPEATSPLSSSK